MQSGAHRHRNWDRTSHQAYLLQSGKMERTTISIGGLVFHNSLLSNIVLTEIKKFLEQPNNKTIGETRVFAFFELSHGYMLFQCDESFESPTLDQLLGTNGKNCGWCVYQGKKYFILDGVDASERITLKTRIDAGDILGSREEK